MKNNTIGTTYSLITSSAKKIQKLITEGYLAGDKNEKKTLTNPITNEEMNKLLVCVRYDTNNIETRELVSYIVGE